MSTLDPTNAPAPSPPLPHAAHKRLASLWYLALALGLLFRLVQYLWRRSYWHDEAALVLNIMGKSAAELFKGPLEHGQAAPPLFAVAERAVYLLLGGSEYALRLLPLLAGLLALLLFAQLAWRILPPPGALLATALFAFSDRLIWHSVEVKQYSGDVLVAVVVLRLLADRASTPPKRLAHLALFTTFAVWFSHTAILSFAGASLALLLSFFQQRGRWKALYFLAHALPAASFLAVYLLIRSTAENATLHAYWQEHFVDWSRPWMLPIWLARQTLRMANYPYEPLGAAILTLAGLGVWVLWQSPSRNLAIAILATIGATVTAAAAQAYPYGAYRLALFMAPALFLLAGAGLTIIFTRLRGALAAIALAAVVALVGYGLVLGAIHLVRPRVRHHIRPVVEQLQAQRAATEPIYLVGEPTPTEFFAYWTGSREGIIASDSRPAMRPGRFWVVVTYPPNKPRRLKAILDRVGAGATEQTRFTDAGAAAFLFDRRESR